jgi:hypothetical protein
MATKKVNIDIIAKDKSKRALNTVKGNLDNLKRTIFNVRNAFVGLGAGLVIRNLVNTGKELENLETRFRFLLKNAEEGAKAFENLSKFASKVPFSLEEIQAGSGILATVTDNAEDLQKMLEITGNVAATTGLDFRTTAEQIQRSFSAGIGAADLFREKGVRNMLGFKAGATVSIEETVQAFEDVFGANGQFGKATDELANTLEGTLSMIGDKFFNFKRVILQAGFFPELKKQFKDLDTFLGENTKGLDEFAEKIGRGLAVAVKGTADAFKFIKDNADAFLLVLKSIIALKVATFFTGMVTSLNALTLAMTGFNIATRRNIIFGSITVFASAMGFLIHKFKEFKGELDVGSMSLKELNQSISDLQSEKIELMSENDRDKASDMKVINAQLLILQEERNHKLKIHNKELGKAMQQMRDSVAIGMRQKTIEEEILQTELEKKHALIDRNILQARFEDQQTGMSERDKKLIKEKIALRKVEEEELQKLINALKKELKIEKEIKALQEFQAEFLKLKTLQSQSEDVQVGLDIDELDKIKDKLEQNSGALNGFREGIKAFASEGKTAFQSFKDVGMDSVKKLQSALTDFVMTGKLNFKDLAKSITRLIVEALIGQAIQSAIAKSESLLLMSSIRKAMRSVFEGALKTFASIPFPFNIAATGLAIKFGMGLVNKLKAFEKGGVARANQPALVGEAGPEIIMPRKDMQVIPNKKIGNMGGPVNVNFTINAIDTRGFRSLLNNERGTIVNIINQAVTDKGRPVLV